MLVKDIYHEWNVRAAEQRTTITNIADRSGVSKATLSKYKTNESQASDIIALKALIDEVGFDKLYSIFQKAGYFNGKCHKLTGRTKVFLSMEKTFREAA